FVFFDVQLNKLDDVWYPQSIFKFSSDGPHLFIHHFNGKNHLFGISMMNDKFGITNFPDTYDYNSNRLCSCVSIYEGDVEIEKVTFINGPNVYGEPVLHSREINGCLVIWFSYRIHGRFETNCTR
ncbi:MAG TPA: hypothetical protein VK616_17500, partial [Flavitalea sp.]|nr:hypothetical protein [Flavitalea sp.]